MGLDIRAARGQIFERLRKAPRSASPSNLQSYLGSPFPVLGDSVPELRSIVGVFRQEHRALDSDSRNRPAASLWRGSTFEEKALAVSLLDAYPDVLDDASWRLVDKWADEAAGWGLYDRIGLGP